MPEKPIKLLKTRASPSANVYRKVEQAPSSAEEFELPNGGKLAEDNRWVSLAQLIPWAEFEQEYAQNFETQVSGFNNAVVRVLWALLSSEGEGAIA